MQIFPLFYVLMNKKSKKCYSHFFQYVKQNSLNLDGATFMTDYEAGIRKAIRTEFPNSKLSGCWFHFCQAVRRRITTTNNELASYIRQNKQASFNYHKILTLPLLPASHILESFKKIQKDIESFDHHFKFASFLEYFEGQWLRKVWVLLHIHIYI